MKIESCLECVRCAKTYDINKIRYLCDCGGVLDVKRDLSAIDGQKLKKDWENRWGLKRGIESSGVWRYREMILDAPDEMIVTRQEGNTRLYPGGKAAEYVGVKNFMLKHEGENPTGSFKDRGMTCGTTAAMLFKSKSKNKKKTNIKNGMFPQQGH